MARQQDHVCSGRACMFCRMMDNSPHVNQKDLAFRRRVAEVRGQGAWALNNLEALEYLNQIAAEKESSSSSATNLARQPFIFEEIERLAFFDSATAAYNFRYIMWKLRREINRSRRYNRCVSVCVVSIGGLKSIAQEYGVLAFEAAIGAAAAALIHLIRADVDLVGRLDADRFMLILPDTPGHGAVKVAERVLKKFEKFEIKHQWHTLGIGASVGISCFPSHGETAEELVAHADIASEIACQYGGSRILFAP